MHTTLPPLRVLPVAHLPLVRGVIDQLGLEEVIDAHLPKHVLAKVSDAECVKAMLLSILSGRQALWKQDQWLGKIDAELLLGEGVEAAAFHDTRLGVALDRLDEVGTDRILGDVVTRYLAGRPADREGFSVHLDTSSVSVYGAYEDAPEPTPLHGYSKDKRPDLKQLIFGMSLHGSAGIPLTMSVAKGNTSDTVSNRDHLSKLAALLPERDRITVVADCKAVDAETLGQLHKAGFHLVSLVPNSHKVRGEMVSRAWTEHPEVDAWPVLESRPGEHKGDPPRLYRGHSYEQMAMIQVGQTGDEKPLLEAKRYRYLVVWSDVLAGKFDRGLPERLQRESEDFLTQHERVFAKGFACEKDARSAANRLLRKLELHTVEQEVRCEEHRVKRDKPGRPRKGEAPQTETLWFVEFSLEPDAEAIAAARREASCFVLLSDWLHDAWDDRRVLAEYRHQYIIEGHTGFRWLKGPAAVAPVFLNKPERIRALGLILVLALMIRNHIQYTLRQGMRERNRGVDHPFRKKEDQKLTTEMAMEWFGEIRSVLFADPTGQWTRLAPTLRPQALDLLGLLGLSPALFLVPPRRSDPRNSTEIGEEPRD